jgi:hypothetical protein
MKYLIAAVALLAVAGCAEHHDLTQCKGPYLAFMPPPQPPAAESVPAPAPPPTPGEPAGQQPQTMLAK